MQENSIPASPNANIIDQAQFEADKRAVYKHPLFSLLALMLEKCEQATQGYIPKASSTTSSSSPNGTSNGESDSFTKDIQAFIQMLEKENRPLLTNNAELDGLMIKALQVLRIHLLELEKVQELCRDFCTRYIACLRGKMQSENLLRSDYPLEHNNNLSNSNSPVNTPDHESLSGQQSNFFGTNDFLGGSKLNDFSSIQGFLPSHANNSITTDHNTFTNELNNMSNATIPTSLVGNMNADGGHSPNHNSMISSQILGSTPLSQIGCPLPIDPYATDQLSPCNSSDEGDSEIDSINDDLSSNVSNTSGSKRQKRGILPKQATSVMRAWLFQHLVHPYPTEDEKRAIAAQTNLTLLQVNNWFINARRRILQPMLEHANDSNQHNPEANSGNETQKKSTSPYSSAANNTTTTQSLNDRGTENTNPNMLCTDNERLLMLQRFASNNYCSSDESEDSFGTESKQNQ
ncbi:homeobox protein PKNOX1-like isoform X1 [Sitodiplosis mosellana]|uniref:homeobox protein PKNOX1-like isoform X1 n=1 Tax=Sitodiplosis mosellana TaxID=263140 RepID=UPI0024444059|nr:homeobox protein PKNOX1-like isoform X1 [Sitodiplosis mosellana]XP_055322413.1 homeobox protein PKNOX1-like isoform X1 [Sitodiplosis mosellana]XP_055322414.1 homeobox protein PKNOX1-like isoform X1 [Sitodiplosis mosellana]XP_055322416.1 homeobox protein PKNOX1-like isoform X1 [Sitodiplosis mosellana]XP_055322417.1 homeobox protein PKNOX1-like isoform X1 [Sitodiplosis mosellana]XP_055322418.1 homeobox protein PKNOX1-like isoform X1 [Sitodiplosis mosellana]